MFTRACWELTPVPDVEWSEERPGAPKSGGPPGRLAGHQLLRGVAALAGTRGSLCGILAFQAFHAAAPIGSCGASPTASGPRGCVHEAQLSPAGGA